MWTYEIGTENSTQSCSAKMSALTVHCTMFKKNKRQKANQKPNNRQRHTKGIEKRWMLHHMKSIVARQQKHSRFFERIQFSQFSFASFIIIFFPAKVGNQIHNDNNQTLTVCHVHCSPKQNWCFHFIRLLLLRILWFFGVALCNTYLIPWKISIFTTLRALVETNWISNAKC